MHILVVDDDEACARLLERALRRLGHDPVVALHPRDALELFHAQKFDAVITDIDMPTMSGIELARQIRAESDIPIAFCTGSARDQLSSGDARAIGTVFPKMSRDGDVARLVDDLRRH
jgi:CheY-like chemotaxis protein